MENRKIKRQIILSILGIMSLVLVTIGVTYAIFNYVKLGSTENTITTGTLKFLYTENTGIGNGIAITNALPVSDSVGKSYATEDYVFDFKVEGANTGVEPIGYEISLRKKEDSTLTESVVKVYLTDMTGDADTSIVEPVLYSDLTKTTIDVGTNVEKTLYQGSIASGEVAYLKNFRLRMWIDDKADFSDGNLNNKTFSTTVNVYANANVVNEPIIPVYKSYLIGDAVTAIDNSKWHVLENSDEDSSTVTLLSDYNLNSDGSYNTACQGTVDDSESFMCNLRQFSTSANEVTYNEESEGNIGQFTKYTYMPLVRDALPGTSLVTIPTAEQIANANNVVFSDGDMSNHDLSNSWLVSTDYWTKTPNSSIPVFVWLVSGYYSSLQYSTMPDAANAGLRPVITTLKSNLL